ncbi:hypothetical protein CBR_g20308 [Chara braunii]|uniref:UDP-N-acetylglucosamine transferase subunit ALG14 n=1 Tax=Chara braunii TaxID=69332 RepID=A0A388L080_CHABU|nr:hypothetical protein CBR_g20308 [Chara braunii]|eukprot:GBG75681.1 hypothetical protein CBR_g20308 [Chara braunii]
MAAAVVSAEHVASSSFSLPSSSSLYFHLLSVLVALVVARAVFVLLQTGRSPWRACRQRRGPKEKVRTLIVLGSGGHTAEMLSLVKALDFDRYQPRWYVAGATDKLSLSKAAALEEQKALTSAEEAEKVTGNNRSSNEIGSLRTGLMECKEAKAHFLKVYRSREVGQSYFTSVGSTLLACAHAAYLVFRVRPDVIVCNGPGTCLPVCVAGFLLKVTGLRWVTMIFVESVCRVQKLSLTGILFYKFRLMDQFYVQWESLLQKYPGTIFVGRVM